MFKKGKTFAGNGIRNNIKVFKTNIVEGMSGLF